MMDTRFYILLIFFAIYVAARQFTREEIASYRKRAARMFQHGYDSYLRHAYPYDELKPLTCEGFDTWAENSLTLIDSLDTLVLLGNHSEFRRAATIVLENANFERDVNVSVFETNIRVVGGLLSAHLLSKRADMKLEAGWPCQGPLLRMAVKVAERLLPAFNTSTGMPYGTVNLALGVPSGETTITCTAGIGTFIVEFASLSRLTGDSRFETAAARALYSLWNFRSRINLFGNHIDVATGRWTATESTIGMGVDSYFEYLVKGAMLTGDAEYVNKFEIIKEAINKHLQKPGDWYIMSHMVTGDATLPYFNSLEAFWPGLLTLTGDIQEARRALYNYHAIWKKFGFMPEFYDVVRRKTHDKRYSYPLRPEFVESIMFVYQATRDPYLLQMGVDVLESIEFAARTECGFSTVANVASHSLENRMESFFLAETIKYLYLLFDTEHFIHGDRETVVSRRMPDGRRCILGAGGYVFNTEAHPIDISAVYCCSALKSNLEKRRKLARRDEDRQTRQRLLHIFDPEVSVEPFPSTPAVQCVKPAPVFSVATNLTANLERFGCDLPIAASKLAQFGLFYRDPSSL